jgi:small conductance mechanosensitive channel
VDPLLSWFLSHGIKVVVILVAAVLINRFLKTFIRKAVKRKIKDSMPEAEERKRIETLIGVFEGTFKFIIWVVAVLMILPEFGVNIAPILAGVGVLGLAVGMAAQNIISDFISGIFIILEDQYHIGDTIKIAGVEGTVKEITLRRTIIKDKEGVFHSVPNSKITVVSRKS